MTESTPSPQMISIIIPLFNEEGNLALLHERLTAVLLGLQRPYELIFVDDGSTDRSLSILQSLYAQDTAHVRLIQLRRNFGKTSALVAGFELAQGEILITMDADLQDDPAELPGMIGRLDDGFDLVAAWRQKRMDHAEKRIFSRIFNAVVSRTTGVHLHDFNCGFKAYRREVIESIRLYSDLHRFIPVLAVWQGFKIGEQPVTHHPRHAGVSKYGARRIARGFMDFVMVLFITRYLRYPLRLFGWIGVSIFSGGALASLYLAALWLIRFVGMAEIPPIGTRPLFSVAIFCMLLGVQLISIGLLGEMVRYYTYNPRQEYATKRIWS